MSNERRWLIATLLGMTATFALWFGARAEWFALAVFALPPALLAIATVRGSRRAGFWAGVWALMWFSHGIMVAWTRPQERAFALVEVALAVAIVFAASMPGLRARFSKPR